MKILISLAPWRVTRILLVVLICLTLAGMAATFIEHSLGHGVLPGTESFVSFFELDKETSVPTLFQTLMLLACSALLAAITLAKRHKRAGYVPHWTVLSLIFLYMALDEGVEIHEKAIKPMRNFFHTGGLLYYPWVVPALVLLAVLAVVYWRFVFDLPAQTRNRFILAGIIYVAGAVGMELPGGYYADLYGRGLATSMLATVEEFLEMMGVVIFLHALMTYASVHVRGIMVGFDRHPAPREAEVVAPAESRPRPEADRRPTPVG